MTLVSYIAMLAVFPFLSMGIINKVKALAAGRKGQPLLQPLFDFAKLLGKGEVTSETATFLFRAYPAVALASVLFAALFVPMPDGKSVLSFEGDFILFAYALGLGKLFVILSAMDTGSSFEGMGASREAGFSVFAEPAFFMIVGTLGLVSGKADFESITRIGSGNPIVVPLVAALLCLAMFLLVLTEGCRVPVDDPNTHLELTMIHEVMILDNSGPGLGLIGYSAACKTVILSSVIASIAASFAVDPAIGVAVYIGILVAIPVAIGVIESLIARMRMSNVPQFVLLATSIAVIALLASVFFVSGGLV
jgi:formate hydrogenlyase subunit 4